MNKTELNIEYVDKLLDQIATETIGDCKDNGKSFNIFSVLGVETKEVIICRLIREFLDPRGRHGMVEVPLRLFANMVLQLPEFGELEAKNATVETEEHIDDQRRVDIVIHTEGKVIPIEVKIWAGDQDSQLWDYYRFYKKSDLLYANKIYYLTPTKWEPSASSRGSLRINQEIVLLSFYDEIQTWIKVLCDTIVQAKPVQIILKQFIEVINTMCEKAKDLYAITGLLGLNDGFQVTPHLSAAIKLLSYKAELEKTIMISYLRKQLVVDSERFYLKDCEKDDQDAINDTHALLKIVSKENGKDVAWVCVETNLYLVAKKVKTPRIWDKRSKTEGKYMWQYISPEGVGKKFPLKKLQGLSTGPINFDECLNDIVEDC